MTTYKKSDKPYLLALTPRFRTRAEQCLAMIARSSKVVQLLSAAIEANGGVIPEVINDGTMGQAPFTGNHFSAFLALFQTIDSMKDNSAVMNALYDLAVRDIFALTPQLPDIQSGMDPIPAALHYVIRPLAPTIRALFAMINDDDPIIPTTLAGLENSDLVDEERQSELIEPFLVGSVVLMNSMLQNMVNSGTSDDLARAIDAACTDGLRIG